MNNVPTVIAFQSPSRDDESSAQLIREALEEVRMLARAEVDLAKEDVRADLRRVEGAAIGFGIAAGCAMLFLSMLVVAIVLALGGTAVVALLVAAALLVLAVAAGLTGYFVLPRKPLDQTRRRLGADMREIREHAV
jgi:hypothetical protein